ncbi:MAG TPA: 4Fe-4S dicluster domain-containing protein [Desulfobacterales bacterium]|nr:4Fe-4S dicluster domain-containing protein [Desulfobacterales bacterium]
MNRRTFLKMAGVGSVSVAAGCTSQPEKTIYALVQAPDDTVTGKSLWYASTCRECPAGCGVLARSREGRVVKVEGNPLHPINQGTLCMRGQAAVQAVYHPDRLKTPQLKENGTWRALSWAEAEALLREKLRAAAKSGGVRVVTEVVGESLDALLGEALDRWQSPPPLVFEPFAYEALKTANRMAFGVDGLVSYRLDQADLLVGLGADFLETWLSPVEYARQFKAMHGLQAGRKGFFAHISPCQSLTAANADLWLACRPGGEAAVARGLIRQALASGRGKHLPAPLQQALAAECAPYSPEKVAQTAGIPAEDLERLAARLLAAEAPLVLGTATAGSGTPDVGANLAANLLNRVLDPELSRIDCQGRHRVETAAPRAAVLAFFKQLAPESTGLLLLNNVNPVFALPGAGIAESLAQPGVFVVSTSNFMDETSLLADLVLPVGMSLECWDEYAGKRGLASGLQPAMGSLTGAPGLGDLILRAAFDADPPAPDYPTYLKARLGAQGIVDGEHQWVAFLQQGGRFEAPASPARPSLPSELPAALGALPDPPPGLVLLAAPSIRFFDGRGANRPWLCEIPDPLTKVAWQTPVLAHPETLASQGIRHADVVQLRSAHGSLEAPVYETVAVRPGVLAMAVGQGHSAYGRYAQGEGADPLGLLPPETDAVSGGPAFAAGDVRLAPTGKRMALAHTDGSRIQHGRKIALKTPLQAAVHGDAHPPKAGLTMWDFPLTLPLPEGYDPKRDVYPPHDHADYRWSMVVDLDRCIGCNACAAACYAENNIGVVGAQRIVEGREMAWLQVERYLDPEDERQVIFLPMMCQHCDNAPCESVCPVYAPHHSKEGLNNQVYNRCIGTRFCSQNCPYKVRRFNWFAWQWPHPLNLQLNPDVTARSKGVMEKCSFCIQRIKKAHNAAKNEGRGIRDGEIQPACLQTCPTGALVFGNLMDPESRVRRMVMDRRAYQVMGYLNTKPAVIYLRKVVQEI